MENITFCFNDGNWTNYMMLIKRDVVTYYSFSAHITYPVYVHITYPVSVHITTRISMYSVHLTKQFMRLRIALENMPARVYFTDVITKSVCKVHHPEGTWAS